MLQIDYALIACLKVTTESNRDALIHILLIAYLYYFRSR